MRNNYLRLTLWLVASVLLLQGCSKDEPQQAEQPAPLVQLYEVGADTQITARRFVARVDALSTVDLSFQVSGRINQLVDKQGIVVPEGELLAALEPQDYELALRQAKSSLR